MCIILLGSSLGLLADKLCQFLIELPACLTIVTKYYRFTFLFLYEQSSIEFCCYRNFKYVEYLDNIF